MYAPASFFALPASLLLLITSAPTRVASRELEWPYNLPPHVKYFPEDEALVKRELSLQQRLQQHPAVGVRKMSTDPDEKFYLDYWSFDAGGYDYDPGTNASSLQTLQPCAALHNDKTLPRTPRNLPFSLWSRSPFDKRDFQCPSGTTSCTSIGYPDSCCPTGETCQIVQNTGLGNVGCCPAGSTCAGSLSSCAAGQTACPNELGGGCCIAGYTCLDVGCVYTGTATVLVTPTPASTFGTSTITLTITTIITPSLTSASPITVTSTTVIVPVPPPVSISSPSISTTRTTRTTVIVPTTHSTTITSATHTTVSNVITCSTGFKSCPASLGGGCCPTDRGCASGYCPALSSTETPNAPVRPTTDTTTTTGVGCPTGYYACSAYYQGGCCQVGRDCAKTNCPTTASTTLVSGNGITIVAPTGNGISTQILGTGVCATGWQACAASNGGGCCPAGYSCGTSCTATASGGGGSVTGKEAPRSGAMAMNGKSWVGVALLAVLMSVIVM